MGVQLHIETFVDPIFAENCYLLWTTEPGKTTRPAWIVDPGFQPTPAEVESAIARHGLTPLAIVLTHCHVDHIAGVNDIRGAFPGVPLLAPRDEEDMLESPLGNLSAAMGMQVSTGPAEQWLTPGDTLALGPLSWSVLDVAGHSPGGLAFYCAAQKVVISGDALFANSIGRTDFPGSSLKQLLDNIREHLLKLPDDTVVHPGHGPHTSIGRERRSNPFIQPGQAAW